MPRTSKNQPSQLIPLVLLLLLLAPALALAETRRDLSNRNESFLYPIVKNRRFGYIDRNGRVVIRPRYEWAFPFSEGLAQVLIGGKRDRRFTAYIDKTGRVVIRPMDGSGSNFSGGVARVLFGASYLYIDKRGRWASVASYQDAEDCTEGLCAVRMEPLGPRRWGYINTSGSIVVKGQYDWAKPFKEGFARVGILVGQPYTKNGAPAHDGKEGFIDKTGRPLTELKFDRILDFSDGMAQVRLNGKWGYIDKTGSLVIPPQYDETHAFHEGLAGVKINNLWGFIDKTGKLVIHPQFDYVDHFSEGLAAVGRAGASFYIDLSGKSALSPALKQLGPFRNGLAVFWLDGKGGVIDKSGKLLIPAQFHSIEILPGGVIMVADRERGIGYANRDGKFFWKPTY